MQSLTIWFLEEIRSHSTQQDAETPSDYEQGVVDVRKHRSLRYGRGGRSGMLDEELAEDAGHLLSQGRLGIYQGEYCEPLLESRLTSS
jgi:hypothetical protein